MTILRATEPTTPSPPTKRDFDVYLLTGSNFLPSYQPEVREIMWEICVLRSNIYSLTLLNKGSIYNPDSAVQRARPHPIWSPAVWKALGGGGGGVQSLQPVQQEDEHPHHRDGSGNAGPDSKVKRCKQGEDVDLLFRFSHQDAHSVVQVTLAEVHHILPLWSDGYGWHSQVGPLQGGLVKTFDTNWYFGFELKTRYLFKSCFEFLQG